MEEMIENLKVRNNLERSTRRWKDNIKLELLESRGPLKEQMTSSCEHSNEPPESIKGGEILH
jgi:hypothetical protein